MRIFSALKVATVLLICGFLLIWSRGAEDSPGSSSASPSSAAGAEEAEVTRSWLSADIPLTLIDVCSGMLLGA
ncbi:hypothetical protein HDK90DRAFT_474123 [Phyllosticta capitalensis]|uniref:Uncharacterized protein n=1 Tax=Phyllosticta capitalensis TaxID=121624 RepID=A0ABR1Z540_9PEZI